jgi:hypothetical protein
MNPVTLAERGTYPMTEHEVAPRIPAAAAPRSTMLHPATGGLILLLDWALFSGTVVSAGTAMWPLSLVGFVGGSLGSMFIQRRFAKDSLLASLVKGIFSGVAVGLPFPIAGTAVGGWILAASGLGRLRKSRTAGS